MKFFARRKKILGRIILIAAVSLIAVVAILYYIVVHKFKESIQYVVNKETNGRYKFDADKAKISFLKKTIIISNASLVCLDTTNVDKHYQVKIPELYFSISSWKPLLFDKKLIIDSLAIKEPDIFIHVHKDVPTQKAKQSVAFQTVDILNFLETTLQHFNAHAFSIKDLSFTYAKINGPPPLHGDHISINIVNFTKVDNNDLHILGSDTISVSLGKQHWVLPDGIHEVSFSKFIFFSNIQRIELDSFMFHQKATATSGDVLIQGDKFFFNSKHFPTIYQKDELIIDTLFTLNPVLTITGNAKSTQTIKDTAVTAQVSNAIFKLINIKFIDVINGEFYLKKNSLDTSGGGAHKSNASIYNLVIDNDNNKQLSTDSIKINLKDIEFYSSDSLSKLRVKDFTLEGRDAVFKNVEYLPSEYDTYKRGITFTAPALLLKNIDLNELMQKRFKAESALLQQPDIIVYNKNKPGVPEVHTIPKKGEEKMALFYRSLHHISDLLNVQTFDVVNGAARYKKTAPKAIDLNVKNFNARFLLNKLFVSDSLVDIKHSIPNLRMGQLNLTASNGMQINVSNYRFDGVTRRNWGDRLLIKMANGTELQGRNIYWEVFDWDVYEKTKNIQVDFLRIGSLVVNAVSNSDEPKKAGLHKDLPIIRLAKLQVNKITFNSKSSKSSMHLFGNDFLATNIKSATHFFTWDKAKFHLYNISSFGKNSNASIRDIAFNDDKENIIQQVTLTTDNVHGNTKILFPLITLKMDLHSTDFSSLLLESVNANDAHINIFSKNAAPAKAPEKQIGAPLAVLLQHLNLNRLHVAYAKASAKDTVTFNTVFNIKASALQTFKDSNKLVAYNEIKAAMNNSNLDKKNLQLKLPSASFYLSNGRANKNAVQKISFATAIKFITNGATFLYKTDSAALTVNKFDLVFNDKNFQLDAPHKLSWQTLIEKITLKGEGIQYDGKKITATAESYSLDEAANKFRLQDFSIAPKMNRAETFAAANWQNDYMIVKGDAVTVEGFHFKKSLKDSSIEIKKIIADGINLNTSRDKSIPFLHGVKKLMPTQLLNKLSLPVNIDSVVLKNSKVIYNEFSVATKKWSTIELNKVKGSVTNITSRHVQGDSLKLSLSTEIYDNPIRKFIYKESYADSLSGFTARLQMSSVDLTEFSRFSKPLAAVTVVSGTADTVFSNWKGNKYAAYGKMNFHYKGLKIKMYNKKDTSKQGFIPAIETWVANIILPGKKSKSSLMYFQRDTEKFVFNYWIKTQLSGILTTVGIKKDKKYKKAYKAKANGFSLPAEMSFK